MPYKTPAKARAFKRAWYRRKIAQRGPLRPRYLGSGCKYLPEDDIGPLLRAAHQWLRRPLPMYWD